MNPLFACCAYYCTGVAIVGIFFYSVLIIFLVNNNKYLLFDSDNSKDDKIKAVGIAIGVIFTSIIYCLYMNIPMNYLI